MYYKKHIKPDVWSKAFVRPLGGLRGGVKGKIKLFQNMVMLHTKLKVITGAAICNMVTNILPAAPLPPTLGS